ncbi:MAG: hypothetical protein RR595_05775 [Lysinibacillus sp.]
MTERKTVKLEDLIKEKLRLKLDGDRKITQSLTIPRLEADIDIEVMKSDVTDFLDVAHDKDSTDEISEAAGHNLIYTIVKEPNLRDKELQEAYECKEPTDIVPALFTDGEMLDIIDVAIDAVGMRKGTVQVVKNLKN